MNNEQFFQIVEKLEKMGTFTAPRLQKELGLDYVSSKRLIADLLEENAISPCEDGISYVCSTAEVKEAEGSKPKYRLSPLDKKVMLYVRRAFEPIKSGDDVIIKCLAPAPDVYLEKTFSRLVFSDKGETVKNAEETFSLARETAVSAIRLLTEDEGFYFDVSSGEIYTGAILIHNAAYELSRFSNHLRNMRNETNIKSVHVRSASKFSDSAQMLVESFVLLNLDKSRQEIIEKLERNCSKPGDPVDPVTILLAYFRAINDEKLEAVKSKLKKSGRPDGQTSGLKH